MLELFVVSAPLAAAAFSAGYVVRDRISQRRHREAARRYAYWRRSACNALIHRCGTPLPQHSLPLS